MMAEVVQTVMSPTSSRRIDNVEERHCACNHLELVPGKAQGLALEKGAPGCRTKNGSSSSTPRRLGAVYNIING